MRIVRSDDRWRIQHLDGDFSGALELLALQGGYRVAAVCEELCLSERYFHEMFLRDVGLTPKLWMRWERMVVARRMLVWGLDALEVSGKLGFSCPNSFRREFQTVYRMNPMR